MMTNDIGKFIQEIRKEKGLTQKELAELIGVSDKTISKWENGNSSPDTSMLMSLSEALEITVNELLSAEKISPENYSMKAEETIMTLMKVMMIYVRYMAISGCLFTKRMEQLLNVSQEQRTQELYI